MKIVHLHSEKRDLSHLTEIYSITLNYESLVGHFIFQHSYHNKENVYELKVSMKGEGKGNIWEKTKGNILKYGYICFYGWFDKCWTTSIGDVCGIFPRSRIIQEHTSGFHEVRDYLQTETFYLRPRSEFGKKIPKLEMGFLMDGQPEIKGISLEDVLS